MIMVMVMFVIVLRCYGMHHKQNENNNMHGGLFKLIPIVESRVLVVDVADQPVLDLY